MNTSTQKTVEVDSTRYKYLPKPLKALFLGLTCIGVILSSLWVFGITYGGVAMLPATYYFILMAIFTSSAFLIVPARKKDKNIPWYDLIAGGLTFCVAIYLCFNSWDITHIGWTPPTKLQLILGIILCLSIMEVGRRMAGSIYLAVCIVFGLYPLFAGHMPGILFGYGLSFERMVGTYAFTPEGLLGLPSRVVGDIVIAFLIFAGMLIASGAGSFFLNLAQAILGGYRGGAAKVAVVGSGFFGSLSGSALSNVAATGSITIPAMKRMGFPAHYAGAIEACASTGGTFMPPIMGAVAFIMCAVLSIEYAEVIIAAAVPSILYYLGLLMQVDSYAAKNGLEGLPKEELPSIRETLKGGWPFLVVFVFLLWGLIYMRWEVKTPLYASGLMILLSVFKKETRMTRHKATDCIVRVGSLITQTMALILPIGFIISGLSITGTSASFTSGLINLGGGNLYLVIIIGILVCYILGMAGMLASAYIFLAVTLAPALIQIGNLNELAVHLFIVYYAMLSALTPPVAVVAFLGASFAGADPMKTAFVSMRLGFVKYFIPLFFLFNPSLIFQGTLVDGLYCFLVAIVGVVIMAAGLDGYLIWVGNIRGMARPLLVVAGLLTAYPSWKTTVMGVVLGFIMILLLKKKIKNMTESVV